MKTRSTGSGPAVYVGLSGGVDSSVAAALLKQRGYQVVGVYMQNWTAQVAGVDCPWRQDLTDARAVAAKLDIPFKVFDFERQYRQKVVDYMVDEYKAGRTPNPDVMCNQEIKFKLFLDTAIADGADMIATGHYARVKDGKLYKGVDALKDQSYFLYRVTEEALNRSLMPIGELQKTEVRQLAKKFDLPTAEKPDSQGICFIGEVSIHDFLGERVKTKPGPIKLGGQTIGQHDGAIFFTIGQRHGLGVGLGKPLYVTDKDMKSNTVFVTDQPQDLELFTDEFAIEDTHWINQPVQTDKKYQVHTRFRDRLKDCWLERSGGGFSITMSRTERAVTPGQSAVIYDGEKVVGGGIITAKSLAVSPR